MRIFSSYRINNIIKYRKWPLVNYPVFNYGIDPAHKICYISWTMKNLMNKKHTQPCSMLISVWRQHARGGVF